jgi:hypothetical protein
MSVNQPVEVAEGTAGVIRQRLAGLAGQSERTLLLGTVLLVSAVSAVTSFVLAQYFSIDAFSSLAFPVQDCWMDWGIQIGRHCFVDHSLPVAFGSRPNPWDFYPMFLPPDYASAHNNYPAAGMVPHLLFAVPAAWLGVPRLGLVCYLLVLIIAVLTPAVWAARGARGLERVVVFVACGAAAIPAWQAMDTGNSVGFMAPIGLVFLVALCRQRWGLVAVMVVLAALVKPHFAVLAVALFAYRRWRLGAAAIVGVLVSNLAAYLLWPRDFPETIMQSLRVAVGYGSDKFQWTAGMWNVSFGKGLLSIPDAIKASTSGGSVPDGYLAGPRSLLGYIVMLLVVACVLALGRRIPPVMMGIALLATASLFPPLTNRYYLIFVLPVAALVVRDPDGPPGSGIFDRLAALGDRRRAVGICVSLAAALSIAQVALPSPPSHVDIPGQMGVTGVIGTMPVVPTTAALTPLFWLVACAAIVISYARRPAGEAPAGAVTAPASSTHTPVTASAQDRQ